MGKKYHPSPELERPSRRHLRRPRRGARPSGPALQQGGRIDLRGAGKVAKVEGGVVERRRRGRLRRRWRRRRERKVEREKRG